MSKSATPAAKHRKAANRKAYREQCARHRMRIGNKRANDAYRAAMAAGMLRAAMAAGMLVALSDENQMTGYGPSVTVIPADEYNDERMTLAEEAQADFAEEAAAGAIFYASPNGGGKARHRSPECSALAGKIARELSSEEAAKLVDCKRCANS